MRAVKKTAINLLPFLGEGIFTMGHSKNYIKCIGGFYRYYSTMFRRISVHKLPENQVLNLDNLTRTSRARPQRHTKLHNEYDPPPQPASGTFLILTRHQYGITALLSNSFSNSFCPIFSFSSRRLAQASSTSRFSVIIALARA